jgi:peptide/nickel transport system permease protein
MLKYILSKLGQSLIVILLVSVIIFSIIEILPGDISASIIPEDATDEEAEAIRESLGLNKSPVDRYFSWLLNAIKGDLGVSMKTRESVSYKVMHALGITLSFTIPALLVGTVIGILFGIAAALNRGKLVDNVVSFFANIGNAAPGFWIAIMLILLFAVKLKWLPVQGYTAFSTDPGKAIRQMILPVLVLMLPTIAAITRQTRSSMLETLNQEYVRTARSKGQKESVVIFKHVLKNALTPILTMLGLRLNICFAGAMVSESIFGIPGMGTVMINSILNQDTEVMLGGVVVMSIAIVIITFVIDILYGVVDPRIRVSR